MRGVIEPKAWSLTLCQYVPVMAAGFFHFWVLILHACASWNDGLIPASLDLM